MDKVIVDYAHNVVLLEKEGLILLISAYSAVPLSSQILGLNVS